MNIPSSMKFEEFQEKGIISSLPKSEKEKYAGFHREAYKDDLKAAKALFTVSPGDGQLLQDIMQCMTSQNYTLQNSMD